MTRADEFELLEFAESRRKALPDRFFADLNLMEADLARGRWPQEPLQRGDAKLLAALPKRKKEALKPGLRSAILAELRLLLCTDEARYKDVRSQGQALSKAGLTAVAAYVAGTIGISLAVATAAVAFIALALLRLGIGVFCRVTAVAPAPPQKRTPPKQGQK